MGVSTIASFLVGKFFSLSAVAVFLLGCAAVFLALLGKEWLEWRRTGAKWNIGVQPLGRTVPTLAIVWIVVVVLSLIDFESDHSLFVNIAIFDQSTRVNLTESVLRTGVPPANPLYFSGQPASMRYYYFWNVLCAFTVARMTHLPVRAVFISSCVWAGFALAALIGLYLKHFLGVGIRLRREFTISILLLTVTGLDICVYFWMVLFRHLPPLLDLEWWSTDQVASWFDSLLWAPHHVTSMVCCMFAFLLAHIAGKKANRSPFAVIALIAATLASSFGLSIYVAFAFFLVMLMWSVWQIFFERTPRPALTLAAGGVGATVLLVPYLRELLHTPSKMQGGALFGLSVREMFSPGPLLTWRPFQSLASVHPGAALYLAKLILLRARGYVFELGFYLCRLGASSLFPVGVAGRYSRPSNGLSSLSPPARWY